MIVVDEINWSTWTVAFLCFPSWFVALWNKPLQWVWYWISCNVAAAKTSIQPRPVVALCVCVPPCVCCSDFYIPGERLEAGAGERAVSHVLWITASHAAQEQETHAEQATAACKVQHRRRTIKSTASPLARVSGAQWDVLPSHYHRWLWFFFKALL